MTATGKWEICTLDRFQPLWQRCLVKGAKDDSGGIFQRLVSAYSESQRIYHGLAHIEHCLVKFDQVKSLMTNPDAVELTIWLHDVVYQPGATDNEALSVEWYKKIAKAVHDPKFCELVGKLIMATIHDGSAFKDDDFKYLVDIDLSSFALPWNEFLRDSQNLRKENPQVIEQVYNQNQAKFQQRLLSRDRFYQSDYFYQRYEQQARDNLARYNQEAGPKPDAS